MVLNTHFLTLILKLIKGNIVYGNPSSARPAASTGTHANLVANMNANAHQARILAATVLAMMLRFATILQPPTIRARDDHIVASIVALLRESAKMDVRLKRRAVAALGETVFYISAQDEELESAADRWTLPGQAVEALVDCLREENDEIVKHYAVKVSKIICYIFRNCCLQRPPIRQLFFSCDNKTAPFFCTQHSLNLLLCFILQIAFYYCNC